MRVQVDETRRYEKPTRVDLTVELAAFRFSQVTPDYAIDDHEVDNLVSMVTRIHHAPIANAYSRQCAALPLGTANDAVAAPWLGLAAAPPATSRYSTDMRMATPLVT